MKSQGTRRKVLENQVFDVFYEDVSDPGGARVPNYLIVSPKSRLGRVTGIAVLPVVRSLDGSEMIGLVRVYRPATASEYWEVPKGFVDPGETLAQAAVRELREETGVQAGMSELVELGAIMPDPGLIDAQVALYAAIVAERGDERSVEAELGHRGMAYFTRPEMERLLVSEVQDSTSWVAIARYMVR